MSQSESAILVLDDDERFREQLARSLHRRDIQACCAGSIDEAITCIRTHIIQRAVIDLRIDQESGITMLEWLRDNAPQVAAVVLTGYGSIATTERAMKLGALRYLVKPCSVDEILSAFNQDERVRHHLQVVPTLAQVEWDHIQRVLQDEQGNITRAAQRLGLDRRSLQRKLAKPPVVL